MKYIDPTGNVSAAIVVQAIVSGLIPALGTWATGGTIEEIAGAFVSGLVDFGLDYYFQWGEIVMYLFTGYFILGTTHLLWIKQASSINN